MPFVVPLRPLGDHVGDGRIRIAAMSVIQDSQLLCHEGRKRRSVLLVLERLDAVTQGVGGIVSALSMNGADLLRIFRDGLGEDHDS